MIPGSGSELFQSASTVSIYCFDGNNFFVDIILPVLCPFCSLSEKPSE